MPGNSTITTRARQKPALTRALRGANPFSDPSDPSVIRDPLRRPNRRDGLGPNVEQHAILPFTPQREDQLRGQRLVQQSEPFAVQT